MLLISTYCLFNDKLFPKILTQPTASFLHIRDHTLILLLLVARTTEISTQLCQPNNIAVLNVFTSEFSLHTDLLFTQFIYSLRI